MRAVTKIRLWPLLLGLSSLVPSGCELQEVELAIPEDVIIGEVVLRAGASRQLAWLHRTLGTGPASDATVRNAIVHVRTPGGA
ncbi:MAG TPA: hypothetical protein VK864_04675, partial [Longimicrobiales bacterium]|nr:hypothetical protein [Longimicrobiales bacterium]